MLRARIKNQIVQILDTNGFTSKEEIKQSVMAKFKSTEHLTDMEINQSSELIGEFMGNFKISKS